MKQRQRLRGSREQQKRDQVEYEQGQREQEGQMKLGKLVKMGIGGKGSGSSPRES